MVAQVLELRPSAAGWYYPHIPPAADLTPSLQIPRPATLSAPGIENPIVWGYGPDGRLRLAAPRPRLWLLA